MESRNHVDKTRRWEDGLGLLGLVLGLAMGAAVLHAIAGPPHLPAELPGWDAVVLTLRGNYLPPEVLAYLLTTAAWAVWLWIAASILLRLFVASIEIVAEGGVWVRSLRTLSDLVTLPMVRRLVDGVVVAVLVVNVVGRTTSGVSAAGLTSTPSVAVASVYQEIPSRAGNVEKPGAPEQRGVEYTVQSGDTLWSIAERFYGTGHEYPRLVAANAGRTMPDGFRFTQAGVIHSGWSILVPTTSGTVEKASGGAVYEVQEGDTLRGIAVRVLGDESGWSEIFDLNRGVARMEDGQTLRDPGLIWPGLRLDIPGSAAENRERPQRLPEATSVPSQVQSRPMEPTISVEASPVPTSVPLDQEPAGSPTVVRANEAPVVVEPEQADAHGGPLPISQGVAGLAGVMGVGSVLMLTRRRVRRSLDDLPVRPMVEDVFSGEGGFVEAEFARALTHRLHGDEVEPVVLVTGQTLRFLAEQGMGDVSVVMACQSSNTTTLTLSTGLLDQPRLMELAEELGVRLGGSGRASITADQDVELQLSGLRLAQLAASTNRSAESPRLLTLGTLPRGQRLYANCRELSHVLIAGLPEVGVDVVLTTLVGALAARFRPEELQLWSIGSHRTLPEQFLGLPHQQMGFVDPGDDEGVSKLLQRLRTELVRRIQGAECGEGQQGLEPRDPDIVVIIGELADLPDDGTTMEMIGVHGPAHGIHLLAATAQPGALGDDALVHFGTRLVLQTLNEEESIRLLGHPEAVDLRSGDLLVRLERRRPVRVRGFCIPADRLDELVRLMRDAHGCHDPGPDIEVPAPRETMRSPTAAWCPEDARSVCDAAAAGEDGSSPATPTEAAEEQRLDRVVVTDLCPEDSPGGDNETIPAEEIVPDAVADTGESRSATSSPTQDGDPRKWRSTSCPWTS